MTTALIWDDQFRRSHDIGDQKLIFSNTSIPSDIEFENPRRAGLVYDALVYSKVIDRMEQFAPLEATIRNITQVHSTNMVDRVIEASKTRKQVEVGPSAVATEGSYETAKLSAGGAMKAIDVLFTEPHMKQSYACIRPPGHHATRQQSMGFCLFNNVAIAAEYARETFGVKKILILDWDVHHGNGTQDIFYTDPDTCFISIHQAHNFPTSGGDISETGAGEGIGYNVNIPLPPGCGNTEYATVLEEIVGPVARDFQPELILLSAGQDANLYDPLGRMMVTRDGFRHMTQWVRQLAEQLCDGKLAVIQEGGYSLAYHPIATLGMIEGLLGYTSPFIFDIEKEAPTNHSLVPMKELIENIQVKIPIPFMN